MSSSTVSARTVSLLLVIAASLFSVALVAYTLYRVTTGFPQAAIPLGPRAVAATSNLLLNSGFDAGYHTQPGVNGRVAGNWTVVLEVANPTFYSSCEYVRSCGPDNFAEKLDGVSAQYIESPDIERCCPPGKPFRFSMYQLAPVVSGTAYALSGYMVTFCGGTANPPPSQCSSFYLGKSVGLDPLGGMVPTATAVIWSPEDRRDAREARWVRINALAAAQAPTMTVWLRMNWPFTLHGALGFIDAFQLSPAPIVTMTAHAPTQTGQVINFSWTGWMTPSLRNDGDYRLYYDVEARDVLTTTWTRLASEIISTTFFYSGETGHAYAFRVRPWAHQPQLDNCTTCAGANHFFPGFFSDAITVTIVDSTPPSSAVTALPEVQTSYAFSVTWSGTDDVSPAANLRYDIGYRDLGSGGVWTDWITNTSATSALFIGQPSHRYQFRSRARDEAGNVEAYPPDADTFTFVAVGSISGTIRNMREQPVPFIVPRLPPNFPFSMRIDPNGEYTLYVVDPVTYTLFVNSPLIRARSEFGSLPPIRGLVVTEPITGLTAITDVNVILPPAIDLVRNGQFETGDLSDWITSGTVTPTIIAGPTHSGNYAALLGRFAPGDSILQQTFFLSQTVTTPTLSFFYGVPSGASVPFTVTVSSANATSVFTPPVTSAGWTHYWGDLSAFTGDTITLTFALRSTGNWVWLDEVSVGSANTVPIFQAWLPQVVR